MDGLGVGTAAAGATFVFALELLDDLVDDLHTRRSDVRVDGRELRGLRFEVGKRREDLACRHETALAHTREERGDVARSDGIRCSRFHRRDGMHRRERDLRVRSIDVRMGFGHHGVLLLRRARDPRYQLFSRLLRGAPLALRPPADELVEQDLHRRGTLVT